MCSIKTAHWLENTIKYSVEKLSSRTVWSGTQSVG